jgi:hypothetical protein
MLPFLDSVVKPAPSLTCTSHTYPHWGSHMGSRIYTRTAQPPKPLVSLESNDLAGVFRDIRKMAEALGAPGAGARLATSLRERMGRCRIDRAPVLPATRGLHRVDRAPHVGWQLDVRAHRHGRRRVALRTSWQATHPGLGRPPRRRPRRGLRLALRLRYPRVPSPRSRSFGPAGTSSAPCARTA